MARWVNDPAIKRGILVHSPITVESEEANIAAMTNDPHRVVLGIARQDDDRLIGVVELMAIDFKNRQSCLGIMIGEIEEWGKGFGTEALRLIVGHAFATLNLNRVWSHVFEDNARAARAHEKVGFKREGLLRQALFRDGRYWDVLAMGVLRDEFS